MAELSVTKFGVGGQMRQVGLILLWCSAVAAAGFTPASFLARRDYPGGGLIAVADVNGDKIPDLIQSTGTTVNVLLGNGNGTFGLPIASQIGLGL